MSAIARPSFILLVLVGLAACHGDGDAGATAALKARLASEAGEGGRTGEVTGAFYALREYRPAWVADGELTADAEALGRLLAAAGDEGLHPADYAAAAEAGTKVKRGEGALEPATALNLELAMTHALLRYAADVAHGRPIARQIDPNWSVARREIGLAQVVHEALADGELDELPERLAPPHPEYARLKEMLQRYRTIAAGDALQELPQKPDLAPGGPGLAALRKNLVILGDLPEQPRAEENVFDEDLSEARDEFAQRNAAQPDKAPQPGAMAAVAAPDERLAEAVRRFEARHGLDPDGVPDAAMIAAMNVPVAQRVRQLEMNLERWRWLPADLGAPHIFINIASQRLQVREADHTVALKMRVITGKPADRTPIFSDTMTAIVFSPFWNIPKSIAVEEIGPALREDPDFLTKKRIEVVERRNGSERVVAPAEVDWDDIGDDRLQLRQKPGPRNSLGLVKFMFPNRHSVYLHDTPNDRLFDRTSRELSHGCVRVEKPVALAAYLLRGQGHWTEERIEAAMHAGQEQQVELQRPLPVHLVYLTARVDEDGVAQFFDDVYGYDRRHLALLSQAGDSQSR